ncbi:MAG: hypothetical protein CVU84_01930 [Firmicutes bacterium HGW-Firmicutes-1]|nr:MAG: hypothetical protein CVU84_01930 [Firmicutes bacterium HGW-Firmicutes-1]
MSEISIGDILKVSIVTYKERWKTLLLISLISTIISTSTGIFSIIITSIGISLLQVLLLLVNLVIMVISVYFTSRLFVTLIIASNNSLSNEDVIIFHSYEEAKHTTWRYIGITLLFGLMLFIPILLMIFGIFNGSLMDISLPIRGILVIVGLLPAVYLSTTFYFSIYAAVLYPNETSVFSYSKQLVKGNFFKVLIITLIPIVITVPIIASSFYQNMNEISVGLQLIYSLVRSIHGMLIAPFTVLISIVAMERLEKTKENGHFHKNVT